MRKIANEETKKIQGGQYIYQCPTCHRVSYGATKLYWHYYFNPNHKAPARVIGSY